eukprot:Gb_38024 [translate_table: standard]
MEIEQRQAEFVQQFVKEAESARGGEAAKLIMIATSHSSLFAFSEILSVPSILECYGYRICRAVRPYLKAGCKISKFNVGVHVSIDFNVEPSGAGLWPARAQIYILSSREQSFLNFWICFACSRMAHGMITRITTKNPIIPVEGVCI